MGFKTIGSRGNAPANWLSRSFGKESAIPAPADDIVIKH
jgi:hypothetical protein